MLIWICILGSFLCYFLVGYNVFHSRNQIRSFSSISKSKEASHYEHVSRCPLISPHFKLTLHHSTPESTSQTCHWMDSTEPLSPKSRSSTPKLVPPTVLPSPKRHTPASQPTSPLTSLSRRCSRLQVNTSPQLHLPHRRNDHTRRVDHPYLAPCAPR